MKWLKPISICLFLLAMFWRLFPQRREESSLTADLI